MIELAEFHGGGFTHRKQRPEYRVKRGRTVNRHGLVCMVEVIHFFLNICMSNILNLKDQIVVLRM